MDSSTFWKNFNLGTELQISGSFIYNGLLVFDEMETFYHEEEIFEFLSEDLNFLSFYVILYKNWINN